MTGAAKEINRGKIVDGVRDGTQRLYRFIDDNPMVEMRPVDYTNDTAVIRSFRRWRPSTPRSRSTSGPGRAPTRSVDAAVLRRRGPDGLHPRRGAGGRGRAIIALPSTAAGGSASRIVAHLQRRRRRRDDAGARPHRRDRMGRGRAVRQEHPERARALIAIAHPHFRDELDCPGAAHAAGSDHVMTPRDAAVEVSLKRCSGHRAPEARSASAFRHPVFRAEDRRVGDCPQPLKGADHAVTAIVRGSGRARARARCCLSRRGGAVAQAVMELPEDGWPGS